MTLNGPNRRLKKVSEQCSASRGLMTITLLVYRNHEAILMGRLGVALWNAEGKSLGAHTGTRCRDRAAGRREVLES